MLQNLIWPIFIISVALAAGSIILSTRLRNRYKSGIFSSMLYYLVFLFTFGFYGIWGQVVIKTFLSAYISPELMVLLSDMAILLGLPFLVFGWLMLIQLSLQLSGRKSSNTFIFWFLFLNISALIVVGYFILKENSISITRNFYLVMNIIYTLTASFFIYFPGKENMKIQQAERMVISGSMIVILVIQSALFIIFPTDKETGIIYILSFFTGNTFLPVYLTYGPARTAFSAEPEINISFDEFCRKFEVSPREKDIVMEICNGLSNQEISDRLFISLQTVKDHTHRIYTKTNVRSRAQLMNLVRETVGRQMP